MLESKNEERQELNQLMFNEDSFFNEFNLLDNKTYAENIIPKKYKELMGLSISIISKCEECILYHIQGCLNEGATKEEIVETIKISIIGGGSVLFPSARYAFKILKELKVL
ncbi:MAG: cytochrome D ubiquinol oxidase subunit II [Marinilabiliales bacterium]|nr:MAG: cytochrome D ubiquinol oxidase subunit II [Marinilabiliales bacterium]